MTERQQVDQQAREFFQDSWIRGVIIGTRELEHETRLAHLFKMLDGRPLSARPRDRLRLGAFHALSWPASPTRSSLSTSPPQQSSGTLPSDRTRSN